MLFIRHGPKEYENGKSVTYCLDPGLTTKGKADAYSKFVSLCLKYGPPERIISSPYLRARETALLAQMAISDCFYDLDTKLMMQGIIKRRGKHPLTEIVFDARIGEYLGNQRDRDVNEDLRPMTLMLDPIHGEMYGDYSARVRRFVASKPGNGWYITHGIVLQSIALFNNVRLPYPAELSGFGFSASGEVVYL